MKTFRPVITRCVFNTERLYTAEGQVIACRLDEGNEEILFTDYGRGIAGAITCPTHDQVFTVPATFARYVMERYDRGEYRGVTEYVPLDRDPVSVHL